MNTAFTIEQAYELLKQYNKDPFHLRHGRTVEGVMRYFARELGYGQEENFWAVVGLLHDLDFEQYPQEHCIREQQLMQDAGLEPE
ncbi:MAG: hydrolase, partial [Negativibacillus sp.]|nr:hydrolase [Negativibacillus sp.]